MSEGTQSDKKGPSPSELPDARTRRLVRSLAERRRRQGLSQTEVAARMGTSQSALARLEAGEADPRMSTVERYAAAVEGELLHGLRGAGISSYLANAGDLEGWSRRIAAQTELSVVIKRLIRATAAGIKHLYFPSEEGVQLGGWDGVAEVEYGNEYVPDGLSVWELGTGERAKKKADEDYAKRSKDPGGIDPRSACFVFVTPRRWRSRPDKTAWEQERRQEGRWRDVRVIDAEGLADWLELAPPVHHWLSERLGLFPSSARPLETWWANWSEATNPPLSPELLVAGRDKTEQAVAKHLQGGYGALTVQADSAEEALAFIGATIERLAADDRDAVMARSLVLLDDPGWRQAVASRGGLVLIPHFEGMTLSQEAVSRHHVLIPVGREAAPRPGMIALPRMGRSQAEDALRRMGDEQSEEDRHLLRLSERASDLAGVARRSLLSLRRRLALSPALQQPTWAFPPDAGRLAPLMLVGSWNESKQGDRDLLEHLTDQPYTELARSLTAWRQRSDPPVRRVGDAWYFVDRQDAWSLLARHLTDTDVERFESSVMLVLGTALPATELPPEDRWRASLLGREPEHSAALRKGLAETLAIAATLSGQVETGGGFRSQRIASSLVARLLEAANGDRSGRLWTSLSGLLPLLAEAAPERFLDAVEGGISTAGPILALFIDRPNADPLFLSPPHTGLLWALEELAWSSEYLGRAALVLARLARLDPGGRTVNRPSESLREIFLCWHPQTSASLEDRLTVLDVVMTQEPEVGWKLMMKLLPQHRDTTMPTYAPRWREWKPSEGLRPTLGELGSAAAAIVNRLLDRAGNSGERWAAVALSVGPLPYELRDAVIERLKSLDAESFDDEGRLAVRDALREVVTHHRRYPKTDWAMPKDAVDRLAEAYDRFQAVDPVRGSVWLFTNYPKLPDVDEDRSDWRVYQLAVDDARGREIQAIYKTRGLDGVYALASLVERPEEVGRIVGELHIADDAEEPRILDDVAHTDSQRREMARGYVFGRFRSDAWSWVHPILAAVDSWSAEKRTGFLLGLPVSMKTWQAVEALGPETTSLYWSQVGAWIAEIEDRAYAVQKLMEHGRAHDAVDLLGRGIGRDSSLDPELVAHALEVAARTEPAGRVDTMFTYYVSQLLTYLDGAEEFDKVRVARLEFAYLPLLEFSERPPKVLHQALATDPSFFADVISWVFKAEGEEPRDITDEVRSRAERGYELLQSWRGIPGKRDDGTLDGEALAAWVADARRECAVRGRTTMGDQYIGRALAHMPKTDEVFWPPEAVCRVVESLRNRDIERGLEFEVYNSRGITSRSLIEGGIQERELVGRYAEWAQAAASRWPRTAAVLRRIAEQYAEEAEREDLEAQLREDQGW